MSLPPLASSFFSLPRQHSPQTIVISHASLLRYPLPTLTTPLDMWGYFFYSLAWIVNVFLFNYLSSPSPTNPQTPTDYNLIQRFSTSTSCTNYDLKYAGTFLFSACSVNVFLFNHPSPFLTIRGQRHFTKLQSASSTNYNFISAGVLLF